ncbi:MAG: hypothetical protein ACJASL_002600 [Paraglaciecola sp.]|jgi:hypothetical protein
MRRLRSQGHAHWFLKGHGVVKILFMLGRRLCELRVTGFYATARLLNRAGRSMIMWVNNYRCFTDHRTQT